MADNVSVFKGILRGYVGRTVKPEIASVLVRVAAAMAGAIDAAFSPEGAGNSKYPVYSGNLHDGTGVGVYFDGSLTSYAPTRRAVHAQHYGGTGNIRGAECLYEALNAAGEFRTGIWIVLFSAVPYAVKVNEEGSPWGRGVGFFGGLGTDLLGRLFASMKAITPSGKRK